MLVHGVRMRTHQVVRFRFDPEHATTDLVSNYRVTIRPAFLLPVLMQQDINLDLKSK